jgi:ABC-type Na+ efflux pump permease subunit
MAIEKWVGVASLALFVMFVAEILTIFNYLTNPTQEVQPGGKILQFISIGIAPAVVLAGTTYLMSRRFGSRLIGSMIISGGAILLVGMYFASQLLERIPIQYQVTEVVVTPPLFMAVSIPVMIVGALLFRLKPKPKKIYY